MGQWPEAAGHKPGRGWERGEGFAATLGGRASAERAELTLGNPHLPAEDEWARPLTQLHSCFPSHFLGSSLRRLTLLSLALLPSLFSPQSLPRQLGQNHDGGWAPGLTQ